MTIKQTYFTLLDHLRETVAVEDATGDRGGSGIVLRHDVDHDLDLALEMAHIEHARNIRATYYLLHTAAYWRTDADFEIKVQQLAAYGHEVGLHINVLSEWIDGDVEDVAERLHELLARLRETGVAVHTVSGHGDKRCYQHQFSNNWLWRELRGDDPAAAQRDRSAEGVVVDDQAWQLSYPSDHMIHRADGRTWALWSLSLSDFGLAANASDVPHDAYWSDTGGNWSRTAHPLGSDLSTGRHQVLVHPVWWRGDKKNIYVLSAARSGSTWLARVIDQATPARAVHEWTLNHRWDGDVPVAEKRTNDDYQSLIDAPNVAAALIRHAKRHAALLPGDRVECNVYLEPFIRELRDIMPGVQLVHLHRRPADVVRSILNRGWYDTPIDRRHRVPDTSEWMLADQFERACWYWRFTNERLAQVADEQMMFERMVSDRSYLVDRLEALGLIVHPLLLDAVFGDPVNQNPQGLIPPPEAWPGEALDALRRICEMTASALGYEWRADDDDAAETFPVAERAPAKNTAASARLVFSLGDVDIKRAAIKWSVLEAGEFSGDGLRVHTSEAGRANANVMLTRGQWRQASPRETITQTAGTCYSGAITARRGPGSSGGQRLMAVFYDTSRGQIGHRVLATIRDETPTTIRFSFLPPAETAYVGLAAHLGDREPSDVLFITALNVHAVTIGDHYPAAQRLGCLERAR